MASRLQAYGLRWCRSREIAAEHGLLLVGNESPISTNEMKEILIFEYFPIEYIERREEEDVDGCTKTVVLVQLPMPVQDATLPPSIKFGDHLFELVELTLPQAASSSRTSPARTTKAEEIMQSIASISLVGTNYRKLRVFSGDKSRKDEDSFDVWSKQARALAKETNVPDTEKKRRIREALRPPALDIIEDLRRETPSASAADYLRALETAFGDILTGEELYHTFLNLDQVAGERPSEYLTRLQAHLRQVVQKGGIPAGQASVSLLKQFIKGTLFDQFLLVDLHLRDRLADPPSYLTLLGLVRKREEEDRGKSLKVKASKGKNVHLNAHEAEPDKKQDQSVADRLDRIEKLLSSGHATSLQQSAQLSQEPTTDTNPMGLPTEPAERPQRPKFCYRCGGDGHMSRKCSNPPDPETVNKKLIKFLHGNQGNEKRHQTRSSRMPHNQ